MKKYILLFGFLSLFFIGCSNGINKVDKPNIETHTESSIGYEVTKLFTVDNMTVYRFFDKGRYLYFVSDGKLIDTTIYEEEDEEMQQNF